MSGVAGKVQAPQAAGWEEMAELLKGPEGHPPQLSWAPSHSPLVGGEGDLEFGVGNRKVQGGV